LGSDTGGSIRQPAALCGCVGLKPTYGRVSRFGLLAFGSSLDQIGPMATTIEDAELCLRAIAGHDPRDSTSAERDLDLNGGAVAGKRIGIVPHHIDGCDPAVVDALERAKDALRAAGAELVDVDLPHERYGIAVYYIVATGEASSNLARYDGVHYGHRSDQAVTLQEVYSRSRAEGFGDEVKRRIMLGTYVLSHGYYDAYYKQSMKVRNLICQDYQTAFASCDVILGPTSPTTAFKQGEKTNDPLQMYLSDIFTTSANLAGVPGISLPFGADADGLPVGLQLQAPQFAEKELFVVAKALEAAR
jgi:aspartyl-tRNA(Asn)/glutamyl-tRNA(Gln) amidotransferase subunit A